MNSEVAAIQDRYDIMDKVVKLHIEGHNEQSIAKKLGMKRAAVVEYLTEYRAYAKDNLLIQERAFEMVSDYDKGQDFVIRQFHELLEETEDAKLKNAILKNISDVQAKRVEVLQKTGMLSGLDMGDQMAEQEEKISQIITLLRQVSDKYPEAAVFIRSGINKIMNQTEPVVIYEND